MSSPQMAPSPDNQYALVPYRDIAEALARPKPSAWLPVSIVALWILMGVMCVLALMYRSDHRTLQLTNQTQGEAIIALTNSIAAQNGQVDGGIVSCHA